MTRTGKIARLPRSIRDELNRRLDNGEMGDRLVAWLNAQADVKRVLNDLFGGRPINKVNLTEWKQGGFLDWQELQAESDRILLMAEGADQIADNAGVMQLTDRLATMAALSLGKVIRELGPKAQTDPKVRQDLFQALRELGRLRREDQHAVTMHNWYALDRQQRRAFNKAMNNNGITDNSSSPLSEREALSDLFARLRV